MVDNNRATALTRGAFTGLPPGTGNTKYARTHQLSHASTSECATLGSRRATQD